MRLVFCKISELIGVVEYLELFNNAESIRSS